jgi:putative ABC transport system permease protein
VEKDKNRTKNEISVYNYILANFKMHKLRYGLTISGLIVCVVFFIIIASLSIGLFEPVEPETPTGPETPEDKEVDPEAQVLDEKVKQTIVNWLYLTSVLIFITATSGVANTILISMTERKREIGILKSVGIKRREIMEIFLAESFTICLIALGIGLLIGLYLSNNVFNYLDFEGSEYIFFGTMRTPPVVIAAACIIVFVVGILAAVIPAAKAAKLPPIEALRE